MAPRIKQALDLARVLGRLLIGGRRLAAGRFDTEKDRTQDESRAGNTPCQCRDHRRSSARE